MIAKKKLFGEINLDELGKAVKALPDKLKNRGYGREFSVLAEIKDNGDISIYTAEGQPYSIGRLKISKYQ